MKQTTKAKPKTATRKSGEVLTPYEAARDTRNGVVKIINRAIARNTGNIYTQDELWAVLKSVKEMKSRYEKTSGGL